MSDEITLPNSQCPVCNSTDVDRVIEIREVPIHCNLLWPTREQAIQAPKGNIQLRFCRACGHIFNATFNPELMEYTRAYENSLHFSPHFQNYAGALAARLVERYDLHGKDIIDIGCGKGEFLALLCQIGCNRGIGFDPSYVPDQHINVPTERMTFIQDFYSERYASYKADFICCRHVLEHIQSPRHFLTGIRHAIGGRLDTAVFFEVPNSLFTWRDLGIWDLIYEHCSYFCAHSLSRLFMVCGFEVRDVSETYAGQFLCIEALPSKGSAGSQVPRQDNLEQIAADVAAFDDRYRNKVQSWQCHLEAMARSGQRAVIWGAGSKGVTFLNTLEIHDQIEYVVDLNPRKHGRYVAGTGQRIVPPEFLRDYQPQVVIVMNSIYKTEIAESIERLGLTTKVLCG